MIVINRHWWSYNEYDDDCNDEGNIERNSVTDNDDVYWPGSDQYWLSQKSQQTLLSLTLES